MTAKQTKPVRKSKPPNGLRARAEAMLGATADDLSQMPAEDARALVHELQVHQMELEIQNDELRQAQVELAESRDRFFDLYEFAPVGYLTLDSNGSITEANLAAASLLGVNRADITGKPIGNYLARESQDQFYLHRRAVLSGETKENCEVEMRRADGARLAVRLESIAVGADADSRIRTALVDITEFRAGEALRNLNEELEQRVGERTAELRSEHEFNERLIETARSIILVLDGEGRVVRFNSVFEELSGWNFEKAEGRDWFQTFLPKRERKRIRERFGRAMGGERILGSIIPIVSKDHGERQIEWFDAPLADTGGNLIGLLWTGNDVTERLQLEQEVYKASEEEKRRIAHDLHDSLGSRLTGIGYRASALSEKLRAGLPVEPEESDTILEQVRDAIVEVRALSRGLNPVRNEPGALAEALKDLAEWVRSSSKSACHFVSADGEDAFIDPIAANHLYRIAQEAVTNAIRHSGATRLTIQLEDNAGGQLVRITDNGSGFDPSGAGRGNGIGLHTMEHRARAIGAELRILPREGGGTTVECAIVAEE